MLWLLGLGPLACALAAAPGVTGRVVTADGKPVAGAVVFVQEQLEAGAAGGSPRAAMDQIDKTFVPGVLPVVAGTEVQFPNHDQIHHHVYSFSRTKSFELPLYKGQDARPVLFDKAGVVKIGCNIHDWMSAVILVLPNPYFAVTDADGQFTLAGLPAGTHKLGAWHELSRTKLDDTLREVRAGSTDVTFTLSLAPARTRPAIRGSRKDT